MLWAKRRMPMVKKTEGLQFEQFSRRRACVVNKMSEDVEPKFFTSWPEVERALASLQLKTACVIAGYHMLGT
jgi:hypothetical protein